MPDIITHVYAAPGTLEGPLVEKTIGEVRIEIWVKVGHRDRFDTKIHPRRAREAAERRPENAPNPCLVPLDDETMAEGGPFVYARVTVETPHHGFDLRANPGPISG